MTADAEVRSQNRLASALATGSDVRTLRSLVIVAGFGSAALFIVLGLGYQLQMYGDGSLFSYAVAAENAWAFHWHNISGRVFTFLFTLLPAETYVELTKDPQGGIVLYGLLFFAAPLVGLLATFAVDRSKGRIIFYYACLSTACLCPLVFGFPTEMWIAHALFWPTLALCHYGRGGTAGAVLIFLMLLALVLTHEAALVLALTILATLALRGWRDARFRRAAGAFLASIAIWALVKLALPPDDYFAGVFMRSALAFFDIAMFESNVLLLLIAALVAYGIALAVFLRNKRQQAQIYTAVLVALALAVYWVWFDRALHADHRYYLRTVILLMTPVLGVVAAAHSLWADGELNLPLLARLDPAWTGAIIKAAAPAFLLVLLVHAVETAKFVNAWSAYKAAVRALATGTTSDPRLGDPRFVSADRIGPTLNRLSWNSTTLYLSVLLAPGFAPSRLVIDPSGNYFWLTCRTATANEEADRAIPLETRQLLRVHACQHRQ
jgi:hypothetical protein